MRNQLFEELAKLYGIEIQYVCREMVDCTILIRMIHYKSWIQFLMRSFLLLEESRKQSGS